MLTDVRLQKAHIGRYGLWIYTELKKHGLLYKQEDGWCPPPSFALLFRFNTERDIKLQHPSVGLGGTFLDVMVVLHKRRVYMIESAHPDGLPAAVDSGTLSIQCRPDNCLRVLDDGTPLDPRRGFAITPRTPLAIPYQGHKTFGPEGIPCTLVLEDRPWPKETCDFPVTRETVEAASKVE